MTSKSSLKDVEFTKMINQEDFKKRPRTDEEKRPNKKPKNATKTCALKVSYVGTNYYGLQINPSVVTIEQTVLNALHSAGLIEDPNSKKCRLGRACRTDRGVHAARNLLTILLNPSQLEDKSLFLSKVNNELAKMNHNDIDITDLVRVQSFFNPKNHCRGREYLYILPVVMVDPAISKNILLRTRTTPLASDELIARLKHLLSKYVGRKAFHNYTENLSAGDESSFRIMFDINTTKLDLPSVEEQEQFLKQWKDTHSNNDQASASSEPQCVAKIIETLPLKLSFVDDTDIFSADDTRFVCIKFSGQSFMLHQIRKMIGMVISVMRGWCDETVMDKSLTPFYNVEIPEAPGNGLLLDRMDFFNYNKQEVCGNMGPITWEGESERRSETFKRFIIIPEVIRSDRKGVTSASWLLEVSSNKNKYFTCCNSTYKESNKKKKITSDDTKLFT